MTWQQKSLVICAVVGIASAADSGPGAFAAESDLYVGLRYQTDAAIGPCWDESEFRRSVANRVGYDPFRETAAISIAIRVQGTGRAIDGKVEWRNADDAPMGERRFVAKDGNCLRLLTEMSFAVGLQIQLLRSETPAQASGAPSAAGAPPPSASGAIPSEAARPQPKEPSRNSGSPLEPSQSPVALAGKPSEQAPATPESPSSKSATANTIASPRWAAWVGAGPSLVLGITPAASASMRLFLGVRRNDLSLEIGGHATSRSTLRQWDGSGFRAYLLGMNTALCGHRNALSACLLVNISQLRVAGIGVDQPRNPTGLAAHAGLRLAATLPLGGPWLTTARVDGLGLLTPCTVDLNQAAVWDMPRFGALAGIDLAARFR